MRTLLLNANFFPLQIISDKRAVRLMLDNRVYLVEEYEEPFRSEKLEFGTPCVIAMKDYVKVPPQRFAVTRTGIFVRDDYECQYCGAPAENLDHVIPQSKGGQNTWENLVASCIKCNSFKGSRMLSSIPNMELRRQPAPPKLNHRFYKERNPQWAKYLL